MSCGPPISHDHLLIAHSVLEWAGLDPFGQCHFDKLACKLLSHCESMLQVGPELTERLHAAAAAQSDETRTLYYLPHMQVIINPRDGYCYAALHPNGNVPANCCNTVQLQSAWQIGRDATVGAVAFTANTAAAARAVDLCSTALHAHAAVVPRALPLIPEVGEFGSLWAKHLTCLAEVSSQTQHRRPIFKRSECRWLLHI